MYYVEVELFWGTYMEKYGIEHWMFFFFLFTFIGWIQESTIESVYHRKLINRGFLKGPYIPIYGVGGCTMLICCLPFKENPFFVFLAGMFSCTVLEYFTGWLMETIFKKQFWDYSMLKFTYKNRISLVSSIFWGILSLFMVYILSELSEKLCFSIDHNVIVIIDIVMLTAMSIDFLLAVNRQMHLRELIKNLSTEQIHELFLEKRSQVGAMCQKRKEMFMRRIGRFGFVNIDRDDYNDFDKEDKDE